MPMLRFRDVRIAVVKASLALAGLSAGPSCLEALAVLLLATGVLARAAFLLRGYALLALLLRLADLIIRLSVDTVDTATSLGVAGKPVF
jgi:hypothetical protein